MRPACSRSAAAFAWLRRRLTPVLIEGPTGSGKELVAEACTGSRQMPQAVCRHQLRGNS
jgi:transcriptional regulator of aromatic amino acid metabolism